MAISHLSGPLAVGSGKFETVTAGKTLTMKDDNGKTLILGDAVPGTITLPAVANIGFHCKVICGFAITTNAVLASAEGDNMEGAMMVASTVVDVDNVDQINFVQSADNIGDWVTVFSDGTYWYVDGRALATGGLTTTDT
jgi:hypothetical protein